MISRPKIFSKYLVSAELQRAWNQGKLSYFQELVRLCPRREPPLPSLLPKSGFQSKLFLISVGSLEFGKGVHCPYMYKAPRYVLKPLNLDKIRFCLYLWCKDLKSWETGFKLSYFRKFVQDWIFINPWEKSLSQNCDHAETIGAKYILDSILFMFAC